MPTFELTGKDGGTYQVDAADEHAALSAFNTFQGAPAAPEAAPVSANNVVRSAATGVPIVGGVLNKLDAATNAVLAPAVEPFMTPGPDSINDAPGATVLDRLKARYQKSLDIQNKGDEKFAADHSVVDTGAKVMGNLASMVPVMSAAPAAFGLAGPMSTMIRNGAISGAALSGADAAVRGEDIGTNAGVGGVVGAVAGPIGRGVGKVVSAVADRVRPPAPVAKNLVDVGGVKVPLSEAELTQNPDLSAKQQIYERGAAGQPAQDAALGFKDLQGQRVNEARDTIGAGLDPTGASAGTAPQDAAEKIAAELIAQEQARQAADTARSAAVSQEGSAIQRGLDPKGQLRAADPLSAAETLSDSFSGARNAAKADYRAKYGEVGAQPGEFAPGSAAGFRGDVERGLQASDNPVSLNPTNTPKSLAALDVIDQRMNLAGPAMPKPAAAAAALGPEHAQNVNDIRARFGNDVAAAYDRQKAAATAALPDTLPGHLAGAKPRYNLGQRQYQPEFASEVDKALYITAQASKSARDAEYRAWLNVRGYSDQEINTLGPKVRAAIKERAAASQEGPLPIGRVAPEPAAGGSPVATSRNDVTAPAAAPKAQSLLEFIASKGGLGPDAELEAIGGHGHTVNVDGLGRRKLVRQGGWPLDYAREAAEEAGYLRGGHNGTSTVNDLLDAIDAELRGQKRFPEGFEGQKTKREASALSEREQHEQDRHLRGFEDDLTAAGHGDLGPDVKQRAVHLMANEGMEADSAVEHAISQLEQEDNAVPRGAGFPGDRQPATAAPISKGTEAPGSGFTMRDVEGVRKQLNTLYGDARRAMLAGGSGSDLHALEHIMDHFDSRVEQMVADGHFSGDGPAVMQMQKEARASFSDYKQKFTRRGSGDTTGAAVEKILGKFSDTKATPDSIVSLAYGSAKSPGGQMPVQIAQRILSVFGRDSAEFGAYKQGLFSHLTQGDPEAAAARINEFLTGKGKLLGQTVFDATERARLAKHADRLQGVAPRAKEPGAVAEAIRRYTGADGAPAASPNKIVNDLFGATGKGAGNISAPLAAHLKQTLSPEGWSAVRQGMWTKLTSAGEGKIQFEAQALSQRLHEFLNEGGSQLAKVLYSPKELEVMGKLAAVYKQMIPVKGTTNPSGTAPMLAKIAGGFRHTLLPMLGFAHGGLPGAAVAYGLDKGLTAASNSNAARNATKILYGEQAKRAIDPRFAKLSGIAGQVSLNQERSRSRSK